MSYKWPPKDPDEVLDYSVDWSRYLDDDAISTTKWYVEDSSGVKTEFVSPTQIINGLQYVSKTNTSTVATVQLGLGTDNTTYSIYCAITTSGGKSTDRKIKLKVRQRT